jgi:hypothetical protein
MLSLDASARNPVSRIRISRERGNRTFPGPRGSVDRSLLARKKRVPAKRAAPRSSRQRDKTRAAVLGRVNPNWARTTISRGTAKP